jgi:hypothetical protein
VRFLMRFLIFRSVRANSDLHFYLRGVNALSPRSNPEGGGVPAQPLEGGVEARNKGSVCVVVVVVVVLVVVMLVSKVVVLVLVVAVTLLRVIVVIGSRRDCLLGRVLRSGGLV